MIHNTETLGGVIKGHRQKAGLSIRQAAAQAGMHYSVLSRIEGGHITHPSPETLSRLARVLACDAVELLELIGVHPSVPSPQWYFRRAYGMTEVEAQAAAQLIEQRFGKKLLPTDANNHSPSKEATA